MLFPVQVLDCLADGFPRSDWKKSFCPVWLKPSLPLFFFSLSLFLFACVLGHRLQHVCFFQGFFSSGNETNTLLMTRSNRDLSHPPFPFSPFFSSLLLPQYTPPNMFQLFWFSKSTVINNHISNNSSCSSPIFSYPLLSPLPYHARFHLLTPPTPFLVPSPQL